VVEDEELLQEIVHDALKEGGFDPQRQTAPGGRGVAVMLIRHPRFARGNDLYETSEVATLGLLAREPLSPTIWEIEADALRILEGLQ